ncbi:hypothetical protein LJC46_04235 [Desulfovibrio sp. OttesenSCG-928-G15]|nr:hypothetical protein [Desulfovibrio sp. OttesenSCG-928-G15]
MTNQSVYDMVLQTEEVISAEEYLRRRERGEITPAEVRIIPADMATGSLGGFAVKLKEPKYRTALSLAGGILCGAGALYE